MSNTTLSSTLGLALRALAVAAMLVGAARTWRRHAASSGERRFLLGLAIVVALVVGGALAVAALPG